MVNDVNKLKAAITNLENQAGKVKEFSGVLHAVNEARIEIDETKDVLKENANDTKQFLNDSRSSFDQLNICVNSLEERLGKIEQNQIELRESINSLDIVSPEDLVKLKGEIGFVVTENVDSLKRHIEVITSQSKEKLSSRMTLIALISVGTIIGIGVLI
jgi:chromosome segregation ATPase